MVNITGTNVTLMVKDMDTSINFYRDLGLNLLQRWGNHYAMIGTVGITFGIHPSNGSDLNSGSVSIGFKIDDASQAKMLLEKINVAYRETNDENSGTYIHFTDPDGTALYFIQTKW